MRCVVGAMAVVVVVAGVAVSVPGCGGGGAVSGEAGQAAVVAPVATDSDADGPAYPVIWSRSLPGESALEIAALQVEPVTGDVVIAGTLLARAQFGAAVVEPLGSNDGIVVRFDGDDGAQLWVAPIAASRGAWVELVGSDSDGDTLIVGEYRGVLRGRPEPPANGSDLYSFVGRLYRGTGELEWQANIGPGAADSYQEISEADGSEAISLLYYAASQLIVLSDGTVAVILDESDGITRLQLIEPKQGMRWQRTDVHAMSMAVDSAGRLLVVGERDTKGVSAGDHVAVDHLITAVDPDDGSTIWENRIDTDVLRGTHLNVTFAGDHPVVIVSGWKPVRDATDGHEVPQRQVYLHMFDPSGSAVSIDWLGENRMIGADADGAIYTVRGTAADRELVKLGPCPVERCTLAE